MLRSRLNKRIATWLVGRFGWVAPKVAPPARGPTIHVIILDGTMSTLEPGRETNAGLTYKFLSELGGTVSVYYEHGLQWSHRRRAGDVLMGRGINRQIRRAYGYLASRYQPGDRIFLMGFSRGAYAVRSLAGVIDMVGLLRNDQATERQIRDVYRHYEGSPKSEASSAFREAYCHKTIEVEMVGVWDTVKSSGIMAPILWRLSEAKHAFHTHALGPSVKNGYHALARHETRVAYKPVMWDSDPKWTGHMEQMWFRGAHGDVGGELGGKERSRPLSNIPLVWMLEKAQNHGLPLPDGWKSRFPQDPSAPATGTWSGYGRIFITRKPRAIGLDPSERVHPSVAQTGGRQSRTWFGRLRQSAS